MFKHLYLLMFVLIFNGECMEQRGGNEVGGMDFQRVYSISYPPKYHTEFNWVDYLMEKKICVVP